jgi:sterol desaturase/sphingolipid hydroxylase (fatty acid hydroxylase superfamily)
LLVVDFSTYWWHRMLHTWSPMWAFHSVHHAQEEMSFITSYRMHPVEQFGQSLIMVVPLLIIGTPTWRWLPLYLTMNMFEAAQHSALNFTYGRAYALVVSPRFHALHHARDASVYNGNYSKILSIWDFLFGTAIRAERPNRFGVEGLPVPRTIWDQLATPFRLLRGRPSNEQTAA